MEHDLLIESADREEKLTSLVNSYEQELNKTKQERERIYLENEKLAINYQELHNKSEELKDTLVKQKSEIKALKERENRLLVDNTDLDGENVQLQEQIVRLKEELVELDTVRHENKALFDEKEVLESQIIEITTLKKIVEKQLEESLNSIREEREHNYQRKRVDHERKEKQNIQKLKDLAHDLEIDDDDEEEARPVEKRGSSSSRSSQEPAVDSLFRELHLNELQVLEKNIEDLSKNKEGLEVELSEFKADLNVLVRNIQSVNKGLTPDKSLESTSVSSSVDAELPVSKQAISQFDRLKADLDAVIKSLSDSDESKSQDLLNKKMDSMKLDNSQLTDSMVSYITVFSRLFF